MNSWIMRPRFTLSFNHTAEMVLTKLQATVDAPDTAIPGGVLGHHVHFNVPHQRRHFWSPRVDLEVLPDQSHTSVIHGLVGPSPSVWTFFAAMYATVGLAGMFISLLGFSQFLIGESSWALLAVPITAVLIFAIHASGRAGRKLAHQETIELLEFIGKALDVPNILAQVMDDHAAESNVAEPAS